MRTILLLILSIFLIQCGGRAITLVPHTSTKLLLNQSYQPKRYIVTAAIHNKGPVQVAITCSPIVKPKSHGQTTVQSKTQPKVHTHAQISSQTKSMKQSSHAHQGKENHTTLSTDLHTKSNTINAHDHGLLEDLQWYSVQKIKQKPYAYIKKKTAHALQLTMRSGLLGHQWAYSNTMQIDGVQLPTIMWKVVANDFLAQHVDAELSCSQFLRWIDNKNVKMRSHLQKGYLEFATSNIHNKTYDHQKNKHSDQHSNQHSNQYSYQSHDLERFASLWSFKQSYPQRPIAWIDPYKTSGIFGTQMGQKVLTLLNQKKRILASPNTSQLTLRWKVPRHSLPADFWFLVNLSQDPLTPFYVRLHIRASDQKWVRHQWPTHQIHKPLAVGSSIQVLDIIRGPWRCLHHICMEEMTTEYIQNLSSSSKSF